MRTSGYIDEQTIDQRTAAWLQAIRASVAPRPHLQLEPDRAALLVIDMVHYFAHPAGRCFLPAAAAIAPRIRGLIDLWRRLERPIVYTRHGHDGPHDLGMLGRFFSDHIAAGEPESEIIAELRPRAGEHVLRKTTYDAFLETPLQSILAEAGVEQVIVTGVLTHMCCETTARAAFCRGFEVYLPVDALASNSEERHVASLMNLADAVAITTSTKEVSALCLRRESS